MRTAAANAANAAGFDMVLNTDASARTAARVQGSFVDIQNATATAVMQFRVMNSGSLTETMRLRGNRVGIANPNPSTLLQVLNARCDGTTWNDACSRELKQDINALSTEAARAAIMTLAPVTYSYKQAPEDQRVGFIAEEVPDLVAMPDRTSLSSMDIVAALTKVVQEQDRALNEKDVELRQLNERLAAQEAAIAAIREQLQTTGR
ncbi:MAG: tail fiber domain-containing protein [Planctomycetaceae bacterium]